MGPIANEFWQVAELAATFRLYLGQFFQIAEVSIRQRLVCQFPEMLGRLQFWRIWREKHQMQTLWYHNLIRTMPASLIQHENDLFLRPGSDRPSEFGQCQCVGRHRDA